MRTRRCYRQLRPSIPQIPDVHVQERSVMTIRRISSGPGLPAGFPSCRLLRPVAADPSPRQSLTPRGYLGQSFTS